jgi:hypothetical protein
MKGEVFQWMAGRITGHTHTYIYIYIEREREREKERERQEGRPDRQDGRTDGQTETESSKQNFLLPLVI